jgi:hypothetical protein
MKDESMVAGREGIRHPNEEEAKRGREGGKCIHYV